jgi:hypothetical protein
MPPAEFEPAISAKKRPQAYALQVVATGIGYFVFRHFCKIAKSHSFASSCLPVRLSAWNDSALPQRILMKFDI